jgi:hypothetical protein
MKVRRARTDRALLNPDRERARSIHILRYAFRGAVNRFIGLDVGPDKRASIFLATLFSKMVLSLWIAEYIGLIMTFPP